MPNANTSDLKLSSASYVPMRLKENSDAKPTPTKILQPQNCEHEHTICTECADSWQLDWKVYWNRTIGGRKLAEQLGIALPDQDTLTERNVAYQLMGIVQHYAPDGDAQEDVRRVVQSAWTNGATDSDIVKMLTQSLLDGLQHGNWPWTKYEI